MARIASFTTLATLATANHLNGPLQDRLFACQAEYCKTWDALVNADNYAGLGAGKFNDLILPPVNGIAWTHDLGFALRFSGFINETFTYKKAAGGAEFTGRATENLSAELLTCFDSCGDLMEPIFQPIGRAFIDVISGGTKSMPCATEFDACMAANPDPAGVSTGSVAGKDLLFTTVHPNASASICQPEKTLLAYKKGVNLTSACSAGDTALPSGGATALSLQKCLQKSRAAGGQSLAGAGAIYYNCLDIGGPDCGVAYTCPVAPTTSSTSGAASTTKEANGTTAHVHDHGNATTTAVDADDASGSVKAAGVLGIMTSTLLAVVF